MLVVVHRHHMLSSYANSVIECGYKINDFVTFLRKSVHSHLCKKLFLLFVRPEKISGILNCCLTSVAAQLWIKLQLQTCSNLDDYGCVLWGHQVQPSCYSSFLLGMAWYSFFMTTCSENHQTKVMKVSWNWRSSTNLMQRLFLFPSALLTLGDK